MSGPNIAWMKEISQRCLKAHLEVKKCDRNIRDLLEKDTFWSKYASTVGAGTLGVILTSVGDPRGYPNGGSLLKAFGMNLKERSSGKRMGEKAITKRGPSIARRWLFFWALRAIQREELKEWYKRFCSESSGVKDRTKSHRRMKGVICMMRKLIRSLRKAVSEGIAFEYAKVIGERPKSKRRRRRATKKNDATY
jgi:transposase